MTFRVGQEVVCVDEDEATKHYGIYKDRVYTIASIFEKAGAIFVYLAEVTSDGGWYASRFRPVVTRKTDISVFTAMLTPTKQRETV